MNPESINNTTPNTPKNQEDITNGFIIKVDKNLSLEDLIKLSDAGFSVQRSSHVGNQAPYNQILAASKIQTIQYDRTTIQKDTTYLPAQKKQDGKILELSSNRIEGQDMVTKKLILEGQDAFDFHNRPLLEKYPSSRIQKYSDLLHSEADYVAQIIEALDFDPSMWTRYVSLDGQLLNKSPQSHKELMQTILDISSTNEGFVFSNELNALIFALIQVKHSNGSDIIYHVSGPDMINYFPSKSNQLMLSKLYHRIREKDAKLAISLPKKLEFVLVPGTHLNLSVPLSKGEYLDLVLAKKTNLDELNTEKAKILKDPNLKDKKGAIEEFKAQQWQLESEQLEPLSKIQEHLLNPQTHSQHDSDNIYVPEFTATNPAQKVQNYLDKLNKLKPKT
jgi:hypothetical protein